MSLTEIAVIGVGLAMDAAAVSMTDGMCYRLTKKDWAAMILFFGIFQGIMPLLGFFAGSVFQDLIAKDSGIVIFLILGVIGGNMVRESFRKEANCAVSKKLTLSVLFFQAVATSIDAFAVGVGFCAVRVAILPAVSLIAVITAVTVLFAILIGRKFGDIFESKAELLGGVILIIIGVKGLL